ncbi:molybdopterin cofactor-binding domain-containing protein [Pelagibacterium sp. H642]|uniref:xanthine dehydrogenase family protein molybdopterin-binding subunit n=1 Tax=Pelagibacterium sp. H642 TaxID=1881069 RepID=UPI0028169B08|nr:molybdopterin cofactor-binding domain-containing protein [Pelagibacterium sp. H642]WMT91924.1 molybdopterin-dependent oxidoreductase [Pelagibacterium sp. H642]
MAMLSRRTFLITGAAIGGTIAAAAVAGVGYLSTVDLDGPDGFIDGNRAVLNAFVAIDPNGKVTVYVPRTEMGQGIHTGLAMLVAEELDLPFDSRIRVEHPSEELAVYASWASQLQTRPDEAQGPVVWLGQRLFGAVGLVATGASSSTYSLWTPMRQAGAAARYMLMSAAAEAFGVSEGELSTDGGSVHHAATGRSISYGDLALAATYVRPPERLSLKSRADWRLIGRDQPRVDLPAKVRGEPVFGMDVILPGMLHASIRQPPVFGATVSRLQNDAELRQLRGVIDVVVVQDRSVAVIADSWWTAEQALWSAEIEWVETDADRVSSADLTTSLQAALDRGDPVSVHSEGENIAEGGADVEASYYAPFVTHACMEPMNATVLVRSDGTAEAWAPTQSLTSARWGVSRGAELAGTALGEVTVHVTMNGGGFGRRTELDVMTQAAYLAALHPDRPVKLVWSREEDIGRGIYRSHAAARLRATLGGDGLPLSHEATVAAQSVAQGIMGRLLPFTGGGNPDGDRLNSEGLYRPYYAIPGQHVASHHVPSHVPIGLWRSNGYSHNAFFSECFLDECAHAADIDPLDYRRALLRDSQRHLAVLERAAAMADWGSPLPAGGGRGIAIAEAFYSIVAQVAEVSVSEDSEVTVDRVFCAVDVGTVINPAQVVAQMEGSISWGLTTALMSANTLEDGAMVQSNFHDFPVHRLSNAPEVTVEIIDSNDLPGGAGEPGVIPVAPAVANAIFDATGRRLRSLPLAITETVGERRTRSVLPAAEEF